MRFIKYLKTAQGVIQVVGVIVSTILTSLTAVSLGADPEIGAAIGFGTNSILATFS